MSTHVESRPVSPGLPERAESKERPHASPYQQLLWMGLLHLPFMYFIMFTMVNSAGEVFHNLNTLYMAGMMVAPMIVLMPLLMRKMYPDRRKNAVVYASGILLFGVLFLFMRQQSFVGDHQFIRSMIPHHSGAVLMCREAKLQDSELVSLCDEIVKGQTREIEQMKTILNRL